jgi:FkbM family methyltransferase
LESIPIIGALFKLLREENIIRYRIWLVQQSPDNNLITRVQGAGKVDGNYQIMHNGLRIKKDSYYGKGITKLLRENRGVHEPQEERVFQEVLKNMPNNAFMLELGSYWGFYSMWFYKQVKSAKCILVEPVKQNLEIGKDNFAVNSCNGTFINACFGDSSDFPCTPVESIDSLVEKYSINHIDILHSDIQGYEYNMLIGAERSIENGIIDYFFVSTHTNELHNKCLSFLLSRGYEILVTFDVDESYSWEGLIVACRKNFDAINIPSISRNTLARHFFDWKDVERSEHSGIYFLRNIFKTLFEKNFVGFSVFKCLCLYEKRENRIYDKLNKIEYDLNNDLGKSLFYKGKFEYAEIEIAKSVIKSKSPNILDIGSNIGYNAIQLAKHYNQGTVYCFEPSKETFSNLKINVVDSDLKNIRLYNIALSNYCGESVFYECADNAYSSLKDTKRKKVVGSLSVAVYTIDSVVKEFKIKEISFIKIDVEGLEKEVLEGATETIISMRPILMVEVSSKNLSCGPDEIINFVKNLGYSVYVCMKDEGIIPYVSHSDLHPNYFFIPNP